MRIQDRVWLSDEDYRRGMVQSVLEIPGEMGTLIKFALYSGLRAEEITYAHGTQICNKLSGCGCQDLRLMNKKNGYSVVLLNRVVGQKHSYFTIISTKLWDDLVHCQKLNMNSILVVTIVLSCHRFTIAESILERDELCSSTIIRSTLLLSF